RRWDEPVRGAPVGAAARDVLRGVPRPRRRAGPAARRLGDDLHRPQRDRGAGARDRPHPAAAGARPPHPPGRAALPLGHQRAGDRRQRQRPRGRGARPERAHPGGQGRHLRHPPRPAPPRAGLARGGRGPPAGGAVVTGLTTSPATSGYGAETRPRMAFFTDTTVCIGCKACEVACKEWNEIPATGFALSGFSYDNTVGLDADHWRAVHFIEQRIPQIRDEGAAGRYGSDGGGVPDLDLTRGDGEGRALPVDATADAERD